MEAETGDVEVVTTGQTVMNMDGTAAAEDADAEAVEVVTGGQIPNKIATLDGSNASERREVTMITTGRTGRTKRITAGRTGT